MSAHASICMAIVGSADLRISLRARPGPSRVFEHHALSQVLLAARRYGHCAIDSVYFHYQGRRGLARARGDRAGSGLRRQELHPSEPGSDDSRGLCQHSGGAGLGSSRPRRMGSGERRAPRGSSRWTARCSKRCTSPPPSASSPGSRGTPLSFVQTLPVGITPTPSRTRAPFYPPRATTPLNRSLTRRPDRGISAV